MEESRFLGLRNHFVGWTEQSGPEGLSLELGDVCRHGCCQLLLDEDLPSFLRGLIPNITTSAVERQG